MAKKPVDQSITMDMTPMIDVTFQLLIFFIVTLKFKLLEKKLNSYLPTDFGTSVKPQIVDEKFITVKLKQTEDSSRRMIDRATRYYVEQEEITGATLGEKLDKILKKISAFRSVEKDAKGKIHADFGVPNEKVVQVLDLYHKAQFGSITFVGLDANERIDDNWLKKLQQKLAQ